MSDVIRHRDISGQKFNRLTAIKRVDGDILGIWVCKCDCGNTTTALIYELYRGLTGKGVGGKRSCGCVKGRELPSGDSSMNRLFYSYKHNAQTRNLDFSIDREKFAELVTSPCYYCGKSPQDWVARPNSNGSIKKSGIDRLDNSVGYVDGNCVPCCARCNIGKGTLSEEDFLSWVELVYKYRIDRRVNGKT